MKTKVLPWFKKSQLAKYGFVLQDIKHDLIVDGANWRGLLVFADARSKGWGKVDDVLFNPQNSTQHSSAVGEALGLPNSGARYTYLDQTTTRLLKEITGKEVRDVISQDYVGSEDGIQEDKSRAHFEEWREVAAKHGIELTFCVGVNPLWA